MCPKHPAGMVNGADPDQTAPLGATAILRAVLAEIPKNRHTLSDRNSRKLTPTLFIMQSYVQNIQMVWQIVQTLTRLLL